jgi:hypothetical protein
MLSTAGNLWSTAGNLWSTAGNLWSINNHKISDSYAWNLMINVCHFAQENNIDCKYVISWIYENVKHLPLPRRINNLRIHSGTNDNDSLKLTQFISRFNVMENCLMNIANVLIPRIDRFNNNVITFLNIKNYLCLKITILQMVCPPALVRVWSKDPCNDILSDILSDIKSLILKNHLDGISQSDYLLKACAIKNIDIRIIKFLIEDLKISVDHCDKISKFDCLTIACRVSDNVDLIKYLVEEQNMDCTSIIDCNGYPFILGHTTPTVMSFWEYIIYHTDRQVRNPLFSAIIHSRPDDPRSNVIDFLIKKIYLEGGLDNDDYVRTLLRYLNDIIIIKYLQCESMCPYPYMLCDCHVMGMGDIPCHCVSIRPFTYIQSKQSDAMVNNLDVPYESLFERIVRIYGYFKNYRTLFNAMLIGDVSPWRLWTYTHHYDSLHVENNILHYISTINPLLFNVNVRMRYNFQIHDPWTKLGILGFKEFKKYTDDLRIPRRSMILSLLRSQKISKSKNNEGEKMIDDSDEELMDEEENEEEEEKEKEKEEEEEKSIEELFVCNDMIFHGDKKIVYGSMCIFDDILSDCSSNPSDPIPVLDTVIKMPKYLIDAYIDSCYTKKFKINMVLINDLVLFLRFIDQYPLKHLSIDRKMEIQLIRYIDKNKFHEIKNDHTFYDLVEKYQLKYLYMHLHNLSI